LFFDVTDLAIDSYAPQSVKALEVIDVNNRNPIFPCWLNHLVLLINDKKEFLEATEAFEVHLVKVKILVAAENLLEDLVAHFIIE